MATGEGTGSGSVSVARGPTPDARRDGAFGAVVRRADVAHQAMADDVALAELAETDAVDAGEDLAGVLESRRLAGGQVDLRDVAGDHRLGTVAEPGEEHLHLLGCGVLRLVEDHEGIVQR